MRTALAVSALAAALGFGAGWAWRGTPRETTRLVYRDRPVPAPITKAAPRFPDYPKPPLETPVPEKSLGSRAPTILVGDLPRLPGMSGPFVPQGPLAPDVPTKLPADELNADEALARRTILSIGADVVSATDAKDASGKVGRALVAEADHESLERLRAALRKALGNRAVLSDGGAVGGSPDTRKAEDALAALKKQRDRARIDFLPESPTLRDLEEATLKAERALADLRKTSARQRLNILLRPTL